MSKWKIIRKATSFTSLRLNCWNITQVIQKCKMLTNFSRILTCYLTQSYLLKKINLLSLRHWWWCPPEVFCKNDVLKNFTIFTEKRLYWSHFLNKVAGSSCLQPCIFIKKRLQHRCFSVNIVIFLRTSTMKNIWEELSLRKLAASALALFINADYLLTGYDFISKKKWFMLSSKMFTFWYCFKIKNNPRTHLP